MTFFKALIYYSYFIAIGKEFITYMPVFKPFLIQGLQNRAEYQVCSKKL